MRPVSPQSRQIVRSAGCVCIARTDRVAGRVHPDALPRLLSSTRRHPDAFGVVRDLPAGAADATRSRPRDEARDSSSINALACPLPLLQEIGHLLPIRSLVELPDDIGADLAGGGQHPKEIRRAAGPSASARRTASVRERISGRGPRRAVEPAPRPPRGRVEGSAETLCGAQGFLKYIESGLNLESRSPVGSAVPLDRAGNDAEHVPRRFIV